MTEQSVGATTAVTIAGFSSPSCARDEPSDPEATRVLRAIWDEDLYIGEPSWPGSTNLMHPWEIKDSVASRYVALKQKFHHAVMSQFLNPIYGEYMPDSFGNSERLSLKEKVRELSRLSESENWDGEGAEALDSDTLKTAQGLVDAFPMSAVVHQPDISVTAHGEVDFDWVLSKDIMLTISVCPSGEIAFAGIFEDSRLDGKEPWTEELPYFVAMCLERLQRNRVLEYRSA